MLITVTMPTGRDVQIEGDSWKADGDVLHVLAGDLPLASFRTWQMVRSGPVADITPLKRRRAG